MFASIDEFQHIKVLLKLGGVAIVPVKRTKQLAVVAITLGNKAWAAWLPPRRALSGTARSTQGNIHVKLRCATEL